MLGGRTIVALAGRFHMYEGHDAALAGFPVRVLHALGAKTLFVSNAAGGIRRTFNAGDLMLIRDHLNLMFRNPLIGAQESGDTRFPDMSTPYDAALGARLRGHATQLGTQLQEGVYAGLLGPTYETPAEVRMLATLGADAVGMSTVPEVVVARAIGMRVAGISCITNLASGISAHPLSHAEVIETTTRVASQFESLVERFVAGL
jgi:purine-nucleoside phosphorylase